MRNENNSKPTLKGVFLGLCIIILLGLSYIGAKEGLIWSTGGYAQTTGIVIYRGNNNKGIVVKYAFIVNGKKYTAVNGSFRSLEGDSIIVNYSKFYPGFCYVEE